MAAKAKEPTNAVEYAEMMEKKIISHIRAHQGPCFGGWGWVGLPVSRVPGNIPPYIIESMVERGILIEGRNGCIYGIRGEVDDNGAQTGEVITR